MVRSKKERALNRNRGSEQFEEKADFFTANLAK
jgi:hypothetical protein